MRGERAGGRQTFRWMGGVRKACVERGMGLEKAKGVCRDRNEWRRMTDKTVRLIKCGPRHTFDAVQKGVGGGLSGVLGCNRTYDA